MIHSYYGNPDSSTTLIQMVDDHDLSVLENEINQILELSKKDFRFIAVKERELIAFWNGTRGTILRNRISGCQSLQLDYVKLVI